MREAFSEGTVCEKENDPFFQKQPAPTTSQSAFFPFVSAITGVAKRFGGQPAPNVPPESRDTRSAVRTPCPWPRPDLPLRVAACPIGREHCLHGFSVAPAAARLHVLYDAKCPLKNVDEAARRVRRLLQKKLAPPDLLACGVDAALLGVCGVTLKTLTKTFGYLGEDISQHLAATWDDLRLLAWDPSLLRKHCPPVCTYGIVTAQRMCSFHAISFGEVQEKGHLTLLDVACLQFTGPMLIATKATSDELSACAARDPDTVELALRCMPTVTHAVFCNLPCNVRRLNEDKSVFHMLHVILSILQTRV